MKAYKTIPLPAPSRPNKQIKEYLDAFNKGGVLVMYSGKSWRIINPDGRKSSEFTTRKEAVAKAKRELTEGKGDLFIFDKSGRSVLRRQQASLNGVFNHLRVKAFFQRIRFRMSNLYKARY